MIVKLVNFFGNFHLKLGQINFLHLKQSCFKICIESNKTWVGVKFEKWFSWVVLVCVCECSSRKGKLTLDECLDDDYVQAASCKSGHLKNQTEWIDDNLFCCLIRPFSQNARWNSACWTHKALFKFFVYWFLERSVMGFWAKVASFRSWSII